MSNWTHVAGIIRVDSLRFDPLESNYWEKTIGKECLYDSPETVWEDAYRHPDRYLPMGSEGSLRMVVWENPDKSNTDAYTVSIFGDLRDHDDTEWIISWFKKKCEMLSVRNAVIEVCNDWFGTMIWSWCKKEEDSWESEDCTEENDG